MTAKSKDKKAAQRADKKARKMGAAPKATQHHAVLCPNGHVASRVTLGRTVVKASGHLSLPDPRHTHACWSCRPAVVRTPGRRHGGSWEPVEPR